MSDLSSFLPKSFGSNITKKSQSSSSSTINKEKKKDPLSSFLPTSFGTKRKSKHLQNKQPIKKYKKSNTDVYDLYDLSTKTNVNNKKKEKKEEKEQERINNFIKPSNKINKTRNDYPLPISESLQMKCHSGAISSMDIDPSGSRLITGSTDYHTHFWDFAGMMSNYKSFRNIEIEEGHPVIDLKWNHSGSEFLVSTASVIPRIYSKDGILVEEYVKGDPYILDMQHTKGHVAAICNVAYDPEDPIKFITASADSTVRIWDSTKTDQQLEVIKAKNQKNTRIPIVTMSVSPKECSKNLIACSCLDGSIQVWPMYSNHRIPGIIIRNAHTNYSETSSIIINKEGNMLISRGGDDTLKFWDLRNTKNPLATFNQLENAIQYTQCIFSPDEKIVVTGTSVKPGTGYGKMVFFDTQGDIEKIHQVDVCDNSVICFNWHPKLNQIFVGCGDNNIHVYYSSNLSQRGILMAKGKDPKKKKVQGYVLETDKMHIQNPNSLELYRAAPSTKRQKLKDRRDPLKSKKPDLPVVTGAKGHSGQVGSGLSQHLVKNMIIRTEEVKDPREALLQYSSVADSNPVFFGDAYSKTQPKTLFNEEYEDEDE